MILYGYGTAFAIGALCRSSSGHGLAAVERVYLRLAIGSDCLDEVAHFVEVSIKESSQEVVDHICLCPVRGQHDLGGLLSV